MAHLPTHRGSVVSPGRHIQPLRERVPDFKVIAAAQQAALTAADLDGLLNQGRAWGDLALTLRAGGAILFPHVGIAVGGHHIAAAVHAALDSGAEQVLVVGVLHARTDALQAARVRVGEGGDPTREETWGIQGPGIPRRSDWELEFSLDHFQFLWRAALAQRGSAPAPRLVLRYPYLAGGRPERLPGIEELETLVGKTGSNRSQTPKTVVLATGDLFHHGIAYGDSPEFASSPEAGGLDRARASIEDGLAFLRRGDPLGYQGHSIRAKSDARDVGKPAPSWVAGALIELRPA